MVDNKIGRFLPIFIHFKQVYFFSLIAVDKNWSASMKKILTVLSQGKDVLKKDKNILEMSWNSFHEKDWPP